jgi:hypothetical protein
MSFANVKPLFKYNGTRPAHGHFRRQPFILMKQNGKFTIVQAPETCDDLPVQNVLSVDPEELGGW